ncbi:MAG: hypothetical protein J6Y28_07905 [Acholeplasmatales bacterium]|nr:hypothetical protein [Acholeplasmatales bacterium]
MTDTKPELFELLTQLGYIQLTYSSPYYFQSTTTLARVEEREKDFSVELTYKDNNNEFSTRSMTYPHYREWVPSILRMERKEN